MNDSTPFDLTQDQDGTSGSGETREPPSLHPERIGRYRVERILGHGGFGLVYLAHDDRLHREVAIKVPHLNLISKPEDAEAYLTEARTVANLDHPNIVPVFDVGRSDECACYVVSKYIAGVNLATLLKQQRMKQRAATELMATVADAIHYAHKQGLVHRDVKPGNILIDREGKPYVVDFGLALSEENIGKGPRYAGTAAYMSPEQARSEGHRVDGRSDIFSLGVMLYELLVGRQPFRGDTKAEILEQVTTYEPRPLRQYDEKLAPELERICLKAMAKRASQRYSSAHDFAEDLRFFLAQDSLGQGSSLRADSINISELQATSTGSTAQSSLSGSTMLMDVFPNEPIKVVPKGLRSFDAHDSEFFRRLLPGPRDRYGMPDSLRFWKTRIEELDPDETFSVGLIYGPSGCGKSSLVKAGLLPQLADDVITVYVEAAPEETERRLLRGLQKRFPELPDSWNLAEALAGLRQGQGIPSGEKLLIVLDQFEQWLHNRQEGSDGELVRALRQCDGGRVQCLLTVRDDFWLAVSRFLRELEVRLVEGHNSALADLFDFDHAREVLTAFGRAFGKLPADVKELTDEQKDFLEKSVAGLAEEGKVICVRLALFAEMMKGRPWTPEALREIGGTSGVGLMFLEETFCTSTSPPEHRIHEPAARAVLRALLPEAGSELKGKMTSYEELLAASGYAQEPGEFVELIKILDGEVRLISPTDPAGNDLATADEQLSEPQKYYQLTHDYLVQPVSDWLTRKQRETMRGRAEICLRERSLLWNAKEENQRLPSFWEFATIRLLTRKRNWTSQERAMMAKASWHHGIRWGGIAALVLLLGLTIQQSVAAAMHRSLVERVETNVASLHSSRGIIQPSLDELRRFPAELVLAELQSQFETAELRKLPLAYALADHGDVRVEFLVSQIDRALADEVDNLVAALGKSNESALDALQAAYEQAEVAKQWRLMARLAMIAFRMGAPELSEQMCRNAADPVQRTTYIEECSEWHGDLSSLAEILEKTDDGLLKSATILAIGSIPPRDVRRDDRKAWSPLLGSSFRDAPDALTHAAAYWASGEWGLELPAIERSVEPTAEKNWFVNKLGMTMVHIPAGSFQRKDLRDPDAKVQTVKLTQGFWMANLETTVTQFLRFSNDQGHDEADKIVAWPGADPSFGAAPEHPVQQVSWYDAIRFCNWLSDLEGLDRCYSRTGKTVTVEGRDYQVWKPNPGANGYRLPTEAEWEYACRAGTVTTFSFGDDESLLDRYATYRASRTERPGSKLPNGWGLFDMHGNVYEWCFDWLGPYQDEATVTDPPGVAEGEKRILRGGSFLYGISVNAQSSGRNDLKPELRFGTVGVRVVRDAP